MANKFLGVPYPIAKDAKGYFHVQGDLDQIKSDLLILLLTNPGERVMLPDFGTGLRQLVFEPNDVSLASQARQLIIQAIQQWEPRIAIDQINVLTKVDKSILNPNDDMTQSDHVLVVQIQFRDPENIQHVEDLRLEVPLGGV